MSEINFLPESFVREQRRRGHAGREAVLIGVVLLGMAGWGVVSFRHLAQLQVRLQDRKGKATTLDVQTDQHAQLEQQYRSLQAQVALQQELVLPIDATRVIATIGQLMPESLTIAHLSISAPRPKPKKTVRADDSGSKKKKKARAVDASAQLMHIELVGVGPSNQEITSFAEELTRHPLFQDVKMLTRSEQIGNAEASHFEVKMDVPLDRWYVPTAVAGKEVANAG